MSGRVISLREWQSAKPFSSDKVSVKNLDIIANAGYDMWGQKKAQRVHISVSLSMKDTFASAAQSDTVDTSTVHYGKLSKALVLKVETLSQWTSPNELLDVVVSAAKDEAAAPGALSVIEAEVFFVKASRAGEGVSLQLYHIPELDRTSTVLCLHRLSYLSLIGVNAIERTMRQRVFVSVAIDRVQAHIAERYVELEQIVEKTVEEATFETLESLAEDLASKVIKYFILAKQEFSLLDPAGVRITIEKPSAVALADTPIIEIYRSAEQSDAFGRRMAAELGTKRPTIPFPLQGRLDEFLQSWKQD